MSSSEYHRVDVQAQPQVESADEETHYANMEMLNESLTAAPTERPSRRFTFISAIAVACVVGVIVVVGHQSYSPQEGASKALDANDDGEFSVPAFSLGATQTEISEAVREIEAAWNELIEVLKVHLGTDEKIEDGQTIETVIAAILDLVSQSVDTVAQDPTIPDAEITQAVVDFIHQITKAVEHLQESDAPKSDDLESLANDISRRIADELDDLSTPSEWSEEDSLLDFTLPAAAAAAPEQLTSLPPTSELDTALMRTLDQAIRALHAALVENEIPYVSATIFVETVNQHILDGAEMVQNNVPKAFTADDIDRVVGAYVDRIVESVETVTDELRRGESEIGRVWRDTKGDSKATVSSILESLSRGMHRLADSVKKD